MEIKNQKNLEKHKLVHSGYLSTTQNSPYDLIQQSNLSAQEKSQDWMKQQNVDSGE